MQIILLKTLLTAFCVQHGLPIAHTADLPTWVVFWLCVWAASTVIRWLAARVVRSFLTGR
jgi:hypothetical protein